MNNTQELEKVKSNNKLRFGVEKVKPAIVLEDKPKSTANPASSSMDYKDFSDEDYAAYEAAFAKLKDFTLSKKKGSGKKNDEPTLEYMFINRQERGTLLIEDYRRDNGTIFKWTGEYWQEQEEENIKAGINDWLKGFPDMLTARLVNSCFQVFYLAMQPFTTTIYNDLFIPTKKHWLKIDQCTGAITAIKPVKAIPLKYQIGIEIADEGAYKVPKVSKRSQFYQFISSSLKDGSVRNLVGEYCGYSLTPSTRKEKFQIWVGSGSNGKSQLAALLSSVHSRPVVTRMEDIAGKGNNNLLGASLIYSTETKKTGFDQEFLKAAVSGDPVQIEAKFRDRVSTTLTAKWLMLCNELPNVSDFSMGVFRRMQIIVWPERFEDSPKKKEDLAKTIKEKEPEVFLHWCLEGLQRLIKNKWQFTVADNSEKAKQEFIDQADKVRLFLSDYEYAYDATKAVTTEKDKIFQQFCQFVEKSNFQHLNQTSFWNRMKNIFPELANDPEKKVSGKRVVFLYQKLDMGS